MDSRVASCFVVSRVRQILNHENTLEARIVMAMVVAIPHNKHARYTPTQTNIEGEFLDKGESENAEGCKKPPFFLL